MSPQLPIICYNNGIYRQIGQSVTHVQDRGYQFSDGVYEVIHYINDRGVDEKWHLERLDYSLSQLNIDWPCSKNAMRQLIFQVIRKNRLKTCNIYISITRGTPFVRDFIFRTKNNQQKNKSILNIIPYRHKAISEKVRSQGISVITTADKRWGRCDIKAISLLAPSMAKQMAINMGADDVLFVDKDGFVTEGSSCNVFIVTKNGELITADASNAILKGITRTRIIELATANGIKVIERQFTTTEAQNASEAFITRTTGFVIPITKINNVIIGDGLAGEVSKKLLQLYENFVQDQINERITETNSFII
jgi:D-alanine transaminase